MMKSSLHFLQSPLLSGRFRAVWQRLRDVFPPCAAAAVLALTLPAAVPAAAGTAKHGSFEYTPVLHAGLWPAEASREESKPDVKDVRARLAGGGLTSGKRAELLRLAARLEMQRGNLRQAERDLGAATDIAALSDADKAENYRLLARLHAGKKPPNFEKAIEYQRKSNEIAGNRALGKR